jgi:hypothetical protein
VRRVVIVGGDKMLYLVVMVMIALACTVGRNQHTSQCLSDDRRSERNDKAGGGSNSPHSDDFFVRDPFRDLKNQDRLPGRLFVLQAGIAAAATQGVCAL